MKKFTAVFLALTLLLGGLTALAEQVEISLEQLLPMGRWIYSGESGMTYFDFNADHTGKILELVNFTWAADGDTVALDYNSQGQDWHAEYVLKVGGGVYTLQNTEDEKMLFVLQGVAAPEAKTAEGMEISIALEELLPSGRWNYTREVGSSFFEFAADGTGSILNMIPFTWVVDGNTVALDYNSQGMDWHLIFELRQDENGVYSLVNVDNADQVFVLEASGDPLLNLIGKWTAPLEGSEATLDLQADGTCVLVVGDQTYNAQWGVDGDKLLLNQNGSVITCEYDGETITCPVGAYVLIFGR